MADEKKVLNIGSGQPEIAESLVEILKVDPVEFMPPPPPQNAPPSEAQFEWFRNNPRYVRMSHGLTLVKFSDQGTLRLDGSFIPDAKMPVHDGNGDFGVGVPIIQQQRRF